jgi:hypothetical protein
MPLLVQVIYRLLYKLLSENKQHQARPQQPSKNSFLMPNQIVFNFTVPVSQYVIGQPEKHACP